MKRKMVASHHSLSCQVRVALVGLLMIVALFATPLRAEYQSPNFSVIPYDPNRTSLSVEERSQLADALVEYARSITEEARDKDAFRGKALALALRLDPDNKSAVIFNGKLKRGGYTSDGVSSITKENLIKMFLMQTKKMLGETNGLDAAAAAYLLDFLTLVDPANEDLLYQAEIAQRKWPANWTAVFAPSAPGNRAIAPPGFPQSATAGKPVTGGATTTNSTPSKPDAPSTPSFVLKSQQSKVNGLVVMSSDDNVLGGKVLEIIATASQVDGVESTCDLSAKAAEDMKIAMTEAFRAVKVHHPEANKGVKFTLSFDDKYTKMAGGSAGTAFAVALTSVLENISIDPTLALTGDITVDGKVRKVGGVPIKIRGATSDGCKLVAIPVENESDVGNLMVMSGYRALLGIQIFSINTLDDAIGLARKDRSEKTTEAIGVFNEVEKAMAASASVSSPEITAKLDKVLELAPNHLSAKYLREKSLGTAPTMLTPTAAIDELFNAASPLMVFFRALDKEERGRYSNTRILVFTLPKETYSGMRDQMTQLEKKMPPQIQNVYYAMVNLLDRVEFFDGQYKGVPHRSSAGTYNANFSNDLPRCTRVDDILKQHRLLVGELTKLDYDKQFVESQLR